MNGSSSRQERAQGDLVLRARTRDRVAFEALLRPLVDPAYHLAYSILQGREEAEDAVQEAALSAWRRLDDLGQDGFSVRPWFFAIVVNQCRRRAHWWSGLKIGQPDAPSRKGELESNPALGHALYRLDARDRLVLFLYHALDLSAEEVGQVLGLSAAGAKSRLYRAMGRLRPGPQPREAST